uniref:Interferon-induced very large GTPase 1 n=1 Tax=Gopherus evgoodei TaxID=1825980 RepID=A0A8C4WH67_9SAUR
MNYRINSFTMRNEYLDFSFTSAVKCWLTKKQSQKTEKLAQSLMAQCNSYIEERIYSKADYDETYCRELLHLINEKLQQEEVKKLQTSLLEDGNFNNFVKYIINYEKFVKAWIWRHILDFYREAEDLEDLEEEILSTIIKKVKDALEKAKDESVTTVSAFLNNFCKVLQKDLVISKDTLVGIQFKNTADPDQFCTFIQTFLPNLQQQILAELKDLEIKSKLSQLPLKPQDEIFKRVFGCGKQCPFCKVPCEAGGGDHKEHFASVHRPHGLGRYQNLVTDKLTYSLCSSDVVSNTTFRNSDTDWKDHPFKDYRQYYPHWRIQPDPSITASDYWKFVFKEFNQQFVKEYGAKPADLPADWQKITKEQALESLKEAFTMK